MADKTSGIIDFGEGKSREGHEDQPGLKIKQGDTPVEVSTESESYPAPLRPNQGPQ